MYDFPCGAWKQEKPFENIFVFKNVSAGFLVKKWEGAPKNFVPGMLQ